jgi:nitrilase
MPKAGVVRIATAQTHTHSTLQETLSNLQSLTRRAAKQHVDILLFPEAYLGGYPRGATFGAAVGARTDSGREQFLHYFKGCVDLGDIPAGGGQAWVERKVGSAGDGTREELERVARETGVFIVVGCVERCGGSLYCAVVYVDPKRGVVGKRRKVMPTGSERLIWAQGQPASLRAVTTTIRGTKVTLAAAICWENYMPLLRHALYSQNVNLYLAPTADARDTWLPLMRTVAGEGRCFVVSGNQAMRKEHVQPWIKIAALAEGEGTSAGKAAAAVNGEEQKPKEDGRKVTTTEGGGEVLLPAGANGTAQEEVSEPPVGDKKKRRESFVTRDGDQIILPDRASCGGKTSAGAATVDPAAVGHGNEGWVTRGGSCIIGPTGQILVGPVWEKDDELLIVDADFDDCIRGRLDLDVAGSYSR